MKYDEWYDCLTHFILARHIFRRRCVGILRSMHHLMLWSFDLHYEATRMVYGYGYGYRE